MSWLSDSWERSGFSSQSNADAEAKRIAQEQGMAQAQAEQQRQAVEQAAARKAAEDKAAADKAAADKAAKEKADQDFIAQLRDKLLNQPAPDYLLKQQSMQAEQQERFKQLLGGIQAPSSVAEVQKGVEGEMYKLAEGDIRNQVNQDIGNIRSDIAERGITGSDIELNAIAQTRAMGERTIAGERSRLALAELERQKAREEAQRTAYTLQYGTEAQAANALQERLLRGQLGYANIASEEQKSRMDNLFRELIAARDTGSKEKIAAAENAIEKEKLKQQNEQFNISVQEHKEDEARKYHQKSGWEQLKDSLLNIPGQIVSYGVGKGIGALGKKKKKEEESQYTYGPQTESGY